MRGFELHTGEIWALGSTGHGLTGVPQNALSMCQAGQHSALCKHQPLQQRVGGQAVGPVQAGAGNLAAGKQPCYISLTGQTRL